MMIAVFGGSRPPQSPATLHQQFLLILNFNLNLNLILVLIQPPPEPQDLSRALQTASRPSESDAHDHRIFVVASMASPPASAAASAAASIRSKSTSPANPMSTNSVKAPSHTVVWRKFVSAAAIAAVAVLLLLFLNLSYLYGSVYNQTTRSSAFHILLVDYDGGIIGRSLSSAYEHLKSPSFPTLVAQSPSQYPSADAIVQAVRGRQYWAAIFTSQGASQRLSAALMGGAAATTYDPNDALTYVWNGVRYPVAAESVIESSFALLIDSTRLAYNSINGTQALAALAQNDSAAVHVYLDPIHAKSVNINMMPQGARVFYNTISMAMPILQQFFFILALNGMSTKLGIYDSLHPKTSGTLKAVVSVLYTFVGAMCMTAYIWAFRESWPVHGYQFVETWMLLWLLMHIYFCLIDAVAAVLPLPAMPFFIVTWIFLSISATINPFEITPGFYRWGYALPAYSSYEILTYIWSGGPAPELHRALPIMFAWWLLGLACAILAHRRRCRQALSEGTSQSSHKVENPLHVKEQGPKRLSVSGDGNERAKATEKSPSSESKEQPLDKQPPNSKEQDLKSAEGTVSSEPEHQQDVGKSRHQLFEATGRDQEGPIKS